MMNAAKIFLFALLVIGTSFTSLKQSVSSSENIVSYTCDPHTSHIRLYWKDGNGNILGNFKNLKAFVETNKTQLAFAMNGGMYKPDQTPQGLFIQSGKTVEAIDTFKGAGNFYMPPNGIFYLNSTGDARICKTKEFVNKNVLYATQSGPLLIFNDTINLAFVKGSENLNIRNGVGILPDGKVVFAMSKVKINFYDFAMFFKILGCSNALYLDGFVSRTYLPTKGLKQLDGNFGVMIGVTENKVAQLPAK